MSSIASLTLAGSAVNSNCLIISETTSPSLTRRSACSENISSGNIEVRSISCGAAPPNCWNICWRMALTSCEISEAGISRLSCAATIASITWFFTDASIAFLNSRSMFCLTSALKSSSVPSSRPYCANNAASTGASSSSCTSDICTLNSTAAPARSSF